LKEFPSKKQRLQKHEKYSTVNKKDDYEDQKHFNEEKTKFENQKNKI